MKKKKKNKGISRIDSKNTHGWYVRIYANGGVFTSKLFSDRQYGSKEKAMEGAVKFRDHNQMVADLQKSTDNYPPRMPFYNTAPKNNSSGVVGVHKVNSKSGGRDAVYFQATWNDNGKMKTKKFYVTKKRTEQDAFELAVACRKQKEKELYDDWQGRQDKYEKRMEKKKNGAKSH